LNQFENQDWRSKTQEFEEPESDFDEFENIELSKLRNQKSG
jgi:hypothetical protein